MKVAWDESLNWEPKDISPDTHKTLPVNFGTEHKQVFRYFASNGI